MAESQGSQHDYPGALNVDWKAIETLVSGLETSNIDDNTSNEESASHWRGEVKQMTTEAEWAAALSLKGVDSVRKLKPAVTRLVAVYDRENPEIHLEMHPFASVTWPLTMFVSRKLGLVIPEDEKSEREAHQAKQWNRRVWSGLFRLATKTKTNLYKRKRLNNKPPEKKSDLKLKKKSDLEPELRFEPGSYKSADEEIPDLIPQTTTVHAPSTLAHRVLVPSAFQPRLLSRPGQLNDQPFSGNIVSTSQWASPPMNQTFNPLSIPQKPFATPWIVIYTRDEQRNRINLIRRRFRELVRPDVEPNDISNLSHEQIRQIGLGLSHPIAKLVNWDEITFKCPQITQWNMTTSNLPDSDMVGFLASIAFSNRVNPIEFSVLASSPTNTPKTYAEQVVLGKHSRNDDEDQGSSQKRLNMEHAIGEANDSMPTPSDTMPTPSDAMPPPSDTMPPPSDYDAFAMLVTGYAESDTEPAEPETEKAKPEIEMAVSETETAKTKIETEVPNIENEVPNIETEAPNIESEVPNIETEAPNTEAEVPNTEAEVPNMETEVPNIETAKPEVETVNPEIETAEPDTDAAEPDTEAAEPDTKAAEPKTKAAQPVAEECFTKNSTVSDSQSTIPPPQEATYRADDHDTEMPDASEPSHDTNVRDGSKGVRTQKKEDAEAGNSATNDETEALAGEDSENDGDEENDEEEVPVETHILESLNDDPEQFLDEGDNSLSSMQTALQQQIQSSFESTNKFEHLGQEVAEALDVFGLTRNTYTTWLPHQFNKTIMGKAWSVHIHQTVASVFDLKTANLYCAILNADEQGMGKTLQVYLYLLFRHLIGVMIDHYNNKQTKLLHTYNDQGKCTYAAHARKKWWPFAYCVCEEKCPDFLSAKKATAPGGIVIILATTATIWMNDFIKFFNPSFDKKYTLTPIVFHNKLSPAFKSFAYNRPAMQGTVSSLHFEASEQGYEKRRLTKYVCITTHHSHQLLQKQLLNHIPALKQVVNGRSKHSVRIFVEDTEQITTCVDTIVYDEFHVIKRPDTQIWKFIKHMLKVSWGPTVLAVLSGTPHAEGLDDLEAAVDAWRWIWNTMQITGLSLHSPETLEASASMLELLPPNALRNWRDTFTSAARAAQKTGKSAPEKISEIFSTVHRLTDKISNALIPIYRTRRGTSILFDSPIVDLPKLNCRDQKVILTGPAIEHNKNISTKIQGMIDAFARNEQRNQAGARKIINHIQNMRPFAVFPNIHIIRDETEYKNGWTLENPHLKADIASFQAGQHISIHHRLDELWGASDRTRRLSRDFNRKLKEYEDNIEEFEKAGRKPPKALIATATPVTALLIAAACRKKNPHWTIALYTSTLSPADREALRVRYEELPALDIHNEPVEVKHEPLNVIIGTVSVLSVGHTFLRATVMRLMEVQNNCAIELQFYKRSHRIGQTEVIDCARYTNLTDMAWEASISTRSQIKAMLNSRVIEKGVTDDASSDDDTYDV